MQQPSVVGDENAGCATLGSPSRAGKQPFSPFAAGSPAPLSENGAVPRVRLLLAAQTPATAPESSAPRPYWPRATPPAAAYAALHASLPNGARPHDWLESPAVQPPPELPRSNRTVMAGLHYPRETPHGSYGTPSHGGTDETVCMMTRAGQAALPAGVELPFLGFWDYFDDLDAPRNLKIGKAKYSFRIHFWDKLSEAQQFEWWAAKVRKLKAVMLDEIIERGREGMDCFVAGECPLEFWPELLADAQALAVKEASDELKRPVSYDIAFPPNLPALQPRKEGKAAPAVGEYELQHPCQAGPEGFMSLCHRKRLDTALSWVHRVKLDGAPIDYFQSLSSKYGNYSEAQLKELQYDAKARCGGYHGPWPSEEELTPEQLAAREKAMKAEMSRRIRAKTPEVAKAGAKKASIKSSKTKLGRISKNPKQRARDLKTAKAAKQRAASVVANFSLDKLRADIALGGGRKKKGVRSYDSYDLVSLLAAKGGSSKMLPIQELQQKVLKLYS